MLEGIIQVGVGHFKLEMDIQAGGGHSRLRGHTLMGSFRLGTVIQAWGNHSGLGSHSSWEMGFHLCWKGHSRLKGHTHWKDHSSWKGPFKPEGSIGLKGSFKLEGSFKLKWVIGWSDSAYVQEGGRLKRNANFVAGLRCQSTTVPLSKQNKI